MNNYEFSNLLSLEEKKAFDVVYGVLNSICNASKPICNCCPFNSICDKDKNVVDMYLDIWGCIEEL